MYLCKYVYVHMFVIYMNIYISPQMFFLRFQILQPRTPHPKAVEAEAKEILAQLSVRLNERLESPSSSLPDAFEAGLRPPPLSRPPTFVSCPPSPSSQTSKTN